ncbi:hypothetical protein QVD17_27537 [Tagetes erecta]|uniref:Uncharacterized protein n=1 Tax=Tagetes erecta TaxID=13708 RepID=A0AAD8K987_TARER|nr:hypothetical protein QVD17_27537 [Tagetes erecta]
MDNKLTTPQSQSSLGLFGIIKESFKTTCSNGKLLVPILLLVFLSYSQLDFAQDYMLTPLTNYLMLQLDKYPNMLYDIAQNNTSPAIYIGVFRTIREILLVKLFIIAISSIVTLVFLVATVSSSYEAYTAKVLGPKDMFLKIRNNWTRPLATSFYLILLILGITIVYAISVVITTFLTIDSPTPFYVGVIMFSVPVCYIYVATICMVSLIVSVLEEGCSGLKAVVRAAELMKGKRLEASMTMVLFTLAYGFVFMAHYNNHLSSDLALRLPFTNGCYCLLTLFMFVVYTVFYHDRKTSHDQKEGKGLYVPVVNV